MGSSLSELLGAREKATYLNALRAQERLGLYLQPPHLLVRNEGGGDARIVKLLVNDGGALRLQDVNITIPPGGSALLPYSGGRVSVLTSLGNLFTYLPGQGAQGPPLLGPALKPLRSPGGKYVALIGSAAQLYQMSTGAQLYSLYLPGEPSWAYLQDDGALLLILGGKGLSFNATGQLSYIVDIADVAWGMRTFSGFDVWGARGRLLLYFGGRPLASLALGPYDRPIALANDYFALCHGAELRLYSYSPPHLHLRGGGAGGHACSYAQVPLPLVENLSAPLVLYGANYSAPPQLYPTFLALFEPMTGALLRLANAKSLAPLYMGEVQLLPFGRSFLVKERGFLYLVDRALSSYRLIYEAPQGEGLELEAAYPATGSLILRAGARHLLITLSLQGEGALAATGTLYDLPAYSSVSYSYDLHGLGWDGRSAVRVVVPPQLHSYTLFSPRLGYDWGADDGYVYRKPDVYPGYPWMPLPKGSEVSILSPLELLDASLGMALWAPNFTVRVFPPLLYLGPYRLEALAPVSEGGALLSPVNTTHLLRTDGISSYLVPWPRFVLAKTSYMPHVTGFDNTLDGWTEQVYTGRCAYDAGSGLPPPSRLCTAQPGSWAMTLYLTRRISAPYWPFMLEVQLFYRARTAPGMNVRVQNLSAWLIDEATGRGCGRSTLASEPYNMSWTSWIRTPAAPLPSFLPGYCYSPSSYRLTIMVLVTCLPGCTPQLWLDNISFSYFPMEATPYSYVEPGMHLSSYLEYSWSSAFSIVAQPPLVPSYSFYGWQIEGLPPQASPSLLLPANASRVAWALYSFGG